MLEKSASSAASAKAEKREKFVKLAENRTRNAIKAIRVIGKLGNKNAYQFDDSDVQKICSGALKGARRAESAHVLHRRKRVGRLQIVR